MSRKFNIASKIKSARLRKFFTYQCVSGKSNLSNTKNKIYTENTVFTVNQEPYTKKKIVRRKRKPADKQKDKVKNKYSVFYNDVLKDVEKAVKVVSERIENNEDEALNERLRKKIRSAYITGKSKTFLARSEIFKGFVREIGGERNFRVAEIMFNISFQGKRNIYAANNTLAEYLGYCDKTIQRAVKDLSDRGLLSSEVMIYFVKKIQEPRSARLITLSKELIKGFKNLRNKMKRDYFKFSFRTSRNRKFYWHKYVENRKAAEIEIWRNRAISCCDEKLFYNTYNEVIDQNLGTQELRDTMKQYLKVLCCRGKYITNKELICKIEELKDLGGYRQGYASFFGNNSYAESKMLSILQNSLEHHWKRFYPYKDPNKKKLTKEEWKANMKANHEAVANLDRFFRMSQLF